MLAVNGALLGTAPLIGECGVEEASVRTGEAEEESAAVSEVAGEAAGADESRKAIHGNSLDTTKETTQYRLEDRDTGEVLKYGETTKPKCNSNGIELIAFMPGSV